jgi:hypothetical protein
LAPSPQAFPAGSHGRGIDGVRESLSPSVAAPLRSQRRHRPFLLRRLAVPHRIQRRNRPSEVSVGTGRRAGGLAGIRLCAEGESTQRGLVCRRLPLRGFVGRVRALRGRRLLGSRAVREKEPHSGQSQQTTPALRPVPIITVRTEPDDVSGGLTEDSPNNDLRKSTLTEH